MNDKLIMLNGTLRMLEVKGENVLILADCIRFVEEMIQEQEMLEAVKQQEAEQ